jgi:hypothetical protein
MAQLWNREISLRFGKKGSLGPKITDLRIAFVIGKTSDSNANTSKIKIYNLNEKSRSILEEGNNLVAVLEAGYTSTGIEILFKGEIDKSLFQRSGADWLTTLFVKDGETALTKVHFEKSYDATAADLKTIVTEVTQKLKDEAGIIIKDLKHLTSEKIQNGFSANGLAKKILDDLVAKQGLEWNIQDGELQILSIDGSDDLKTDAVVLTPETGLIGSPIRREEGVEFKALLQPKVKPGKIVKIQSRSIDGFYRIRKAQFKGDTHGTPWFVTATAVPFNELAQ